MKTTRRGLLTAELTTAQGELALYADKSGQPLATGRRIDYAAGGANETYYLKINGTSDPWGCAC